MTHLGDRLHLIFLADIRRVCTTMSGEVVDRGDCHNLVFSVQIGLERETVTVALGGSAEFTMSTLTDIACAFVDRKVSVPYTGSCIMLLLKKSRGYYRP